MPEETHHNEQETKQEQEVGQEPQVFAVKRDLAGWRFSRRDFLTAASAATAAAVAGTATGCGAPGVEVAATAVPATSTPAPTKVMQITRMPTSTNTPKPTKAPTPTKVPSPTRTRTPTKTPTPTQTPTPTPKPMPLAEFVEDVTIPDDTVMEPGYAFTKTWRVKNSGSMDWGEGVKLIFRDGDQMGATSPAPVSNVKPGDTIDISLEMVAPTEVGNYKGEWHLETADGSWLTTLWVVIVVASPEPIPAGQEGIEIQVTQPDGVTRTFTLPCGSPIPAGAVCVCNCVVAEVPGEPGEVPAGQEGINFTGPGGETRTMPCGSPIPAGWTCSCNCVSVPPACSCVGHCSCDRQGGHYWYPC